MDTPLTRGRSVFDAPVHVTTSSTAIRTRLSISLLQGTVNEPWDLSPSVPVCALGGDRLLKSADYLHPLGQCLGFPSGESISSCLVEHLPYWGLCIDRCSINECCRQIPHCLVRLMAFRSTSVTINTHYINFMYQLASLGTLLWKPKMCHSRARPLCMPAKRLQNACDGGWRRRRKKEISFHACPACCSPRRKPRTQREMWNLGGCLRWSPVCVPHRDERGRVVRIASSRPDNGWQMVSIWGAKPEL